MHANQYIFTLIVLITALLLGMCTRPTSINSEQESQLARLAVIKVDASKIELYNEFLREEIEASIRLESGVITLYGVAAKDHPEHVTLFETYADSSRYQAHLTTPHFQKYKQGTTEMVKHLDLIQMQRILYHRKREISNANTDDLYIRLIKIEIDSNTVENFKALVTNVLLPGLESEPGVLVMYMLAEKDHPSRISTLEVYQNPDAYNKHLKTPHYQAYKERTKTIVKSLNLIDVNPIFLGSKPAE